MLTWQGSFIHLIQVQFCFFLMDSLSQCFAPRFVSYVLLFSRFGKKSRPAMYDAAPISYEDYSPDDKPLVTLIKTKDL